jgi:hypothetical protein
MIAIRQPSHGTAASVERLQAPSATATAGVTLAGQSIAERTRTGTLRVPVRAGTPTASGGRYELALPPASAAMVTISLGR